MRCIINLFFLLVIATVLLGCQSDAVESGAVQPPFDAVPAEFEFREFQLPQDWEIVILSEHFPVESIAPGGVKYTENANEIRMLFGEKSKTNKVNLTEINEAEEERNAGFRTLYHHSHEKKYGEMAIWKVQEPVEDEKNALESTVFQTFDEMPYVEVDGKKVYYYIWDGRDNPMFYLWFSDDKKYRYSFGHYENERLTIEDAMPFLEKLTIEQ
ncbi:hypothetical protein [Alkalihalobacterium chitinilyticum]|uniref:Uncharacterized protein n=1 Tax=Alkalihalobacterium chitinilyticum TaxID=2980103 RepID=A0ABT5VNK8_9BACI|nr:hypothetical protein [Alkalihalobacterium chitinilyticum]MDE5416068.1 hypothetical protein [Alkalihalobacterium chitinilyticum]